MKNEKVRGIICSKTNLMDREVGEECRCSVMEPIMCRLVLGKTKLGIVFHSNFSPLKTTNIIYALFILFIVFKI